jgi:hypothetical protein
MLQNIKYIKCEKFLNNSDSEINDRDIYIMTKYISNDELNYYIKNIKDNNKISNIIKITKDIINKGYVFNSLILKLIDYLINDNTIDDKIKAKILFDMSFIEKNINDGADEYIQLLKLLNNISII